MTTQQPRRGAHRSGTDEDVATGTIVRRLAAAALLVALSALVWLSSFSESEAARICAVQAEPGQRICRPIEVTDPALLLPLLGLFGLVAPGFRRLSAAGVELEPRVSEVGKNEDLGQDENSLAQLRAKFDRQIEQARSERDQERG